MKLKHREFKSLTQDHTDGNRWNHGLNKCKMLTKDKRYYKKAERPFWIKHKIIRAWPKQRNKQITHLQPSLGGESRTTRKNQQNSLLFRSFISTIFLPKFHVFFPFLRPDYTQIEGFPEGLNLSPIISNLIVKKKPLNM